MSLLIVGSCSRVTQGIIQRLARQKTYERITVADLLPLYDFHQRFYRLKKQLSSQQLSTKVDLVKIFQLTELNQAIHSHNDLLFVTHDYFSSVTSKTKLMEVTAQLSAQVTLIVVRKELFLLRHSSTTIMGLLILKLIFRNRDKNL